MNSMTTVRLEETNGQPLIRRIADGLGFVFVAGIFASVFLVLAFTAILVLLLFRPKVC